MDVERKASSYFSVICIGCIIHILFEVLFIALKMPSTMIIYNILSIIVFGTGAWILYKKEDPKKALYNYLFQPTLDLLWH